jgi:hypothetical protein
MLETKEQKQYLALCLLMVVVLGFITFRKSPNFAYKEPQFKPTKSFDYAGYLASIKVDEKAGKQLLENLVTEEDVKKQVEKDLDVTQKIVPPELEEAKLSIEKTSAKEKVVSYLRSVGQASDEFNQKGVEFSSALFDPQADKQVLQKAQQENSAVLQKLYAQKAPSEVTDLHKAVVTVYEAYGKTLLESSNYAQNNSLQPWPKLYNNFVVINDKMSIVRDELKKLDNKYKLASLPIYENIAENDSNGFFIKKAHAVFGLGDTTIILGNIPEVVEKAIREGLSTAFANFASQFLNKLIAQIEKNYLVANFLYYSDALVRGQYVDDYLNKYVTNSLDQAMVKNFIPQFNCGQVTNLKNVFKAKSAERLGFDPENIDPKDPDYFIKLGKVGDFLATADGWQIYYEDVATQVQSEAQKAVDRELSSSGLKTPRDLTGAKIAQSITSIQGSMNAVMNAQLNLGVVNVDKIVGSIVKNLTYNLFNKFVFKGAVVYKEQGTCVPVPQVSPIIPSSETEYTAPPTPPSNEEIIKQQCEQFPESCKTTPANTTP